MKTYLLITKIIYSKKQILKSIVSFFCVLFILGNIMTSFAEMYADYSYYVKPYKDAQYDMVLSDLTKEEFENQFTMDNINKYITFFSSVINPRFRCRSRSFFINEDLNATKIISSNNNLNDVVNFVLKDSILSKDVNVLDKCNAIVITDELALQLDAQVGDKIYINCWTSVSETNEGTILYNFENDNEYEFILGAIYKDNLMVSSSAIICDSNMRIIVADNYSDRYRDEQHKEWIGNMYSEIFVEFIDKKVGIEETYKYIPIDKALYYRYGDEWKTNIKENLIYDSYQDYVDDMLKNNNLYYTSKDTLTINAEKNSLLNTKTIVFNFLVVSLAVTLIYISKYYKQIKLSRKGIGILVSEGMPIKKVFVFIFLTSLLEQIFSMGLLLVLQTVMYKLYPTPINAEVLNLYVIKFTYIPLVLSALFSSIMVSFFAASNLTRKELLKAVSGQ